MRTKELYIKTDSLRSFICIFVSIIDISLCSAQKNKNQLDWNSWPKEASPIAIGRLVTQHFLQSPHAVYNAPNTKPHIPYFEVCAWYGALTYSGLAKNDTLKSQLINRFNPLITTDSSLLPVPDHVDYTVFGALPFEIYLQTRNQRYFELGKYYADKQWAAPEGPRVIPESYTYFNEGYSWQTRLWIDDMYMITAIQAQAYRATRDTKYLDRAAKEMVFYLDKLQQPNGLFYHSPEAPFYWGRGNGWMAAGMTELLRVLPKDNRYQPEIMKRYKTMMTSLLNYQSNDGMWRQLVDDTTSWKETSCTGMFTFAMITGVKNGWLDNKVYGPAASKGWLSLIHYLNEKGEITDVCEGTGIKNDHDYYLNRKRITGDFHGQAPVLWCASALLREKEKQ